MAQNSYQQRQEEAARQALIVQPPRLPMPSQAVDAGIAPGTWKVLVEAKFPSAKTVDGVLLAVEYCKARGLDIMKSVVHVVPMWNSTLGREVETVWPGIAELRTTASRTGQWGGNDEVVFGPTQKRGFSEKKTIPGRNNQADKVMEAACDEFEWPLWAQITVYKIVQGNRVAFVGPKVLFTETFSGVKGLQVPNSMWIKRPFGQLEKCAEAAALRRGFPEELGDQWTSEEMEGKTWMGHNGGPELDEDATDKKTAPTRDGIKAELEAEADGGSAEVSAEVSVFDWPDNKFDAFRADIELACSSAQVPQDLHNDWAKHQNTIEALNDPRFKIIESMFEDALAKLAPAKGGGAQAAVDITPAEIEHYKTQIRDRLARVEFLVDLGSLEAGEKGNLATLPDEAAAEVQAMIDARRADFTRKPHTETTENEDEQESTD